MDQRAFFDYLRKLPLFIAGAIIISIFISLSSAFISLDFDKVPFLDGLVAFNTGASIAVFLALIQSNETYIKKLRQYGRASRNVYMTVFLNTFLVVVANGLSHSSSKLLNVGLDSFTTVLAVLITVYTLVRIKTLLNLYLR